MYVNFWLETLDTFLLTEICCRVLPQEGKRAKDHPHNNAFFYHWLVISTGFHLQSLSHWCMQDMHRAQVVVTSWNSSPWGSQTFLPPVTNSRPRQDFLTVIILAINLMYLSFGVKVFIMIDHLDQLSPHRLNNDSFTWSAERETSGRRKIGKEL